MKDFSELEQFFSLFPVHMYMLDLNGCYRACNALQAVNFGLKPTENIFGKTNYDLPSLKNHPDIIKVWENNNKQVFEKKKPFEFYEPFPQKESIGHYKSYKIPIFEDNKLIGLIGISFDLSDEMDKSNALKLQIDQKELMLSHVLDNLPEHIYWLNNDNVFLGCNANQANDFGLKNSAEIVGLHVSNFQTKENAEILVENNNKIIQTGQEISAEENFRNRKGENVYYLSKKVPLQNKAKEIIGILGISVDITPQKKLEESLRYAKEAAEAANEAKTEFLSNMRHDIRTPLSGIIGFSELLKSESQETHIKDYADNLIASSHALLHLLDEVLEAVRVSSGEIPKLKRKFNLSHLFEQVIALCKARAGEKRLQLNLELDSKLPNFAIGDKIRVHRIALELISNALNFTDEGHVTLKVELAKQENRSLIIKMTVTDSGMGIAKGQQQDIYVQFKRLTPSYQGIYKGAGLGLYVVKQFIDELEGEIYVESEPHKGSCFTCLIPLQESLLDDASGIDEAAEFKVDEPYLAPLSLQAPATDESLPDSNTSSRVLVVEDNTLAQMAVKILLTSMACHVDVASNGKDAIFCCQKTKYDLILMDIGLGDGMDGYDVTRHIRSINGELKDTPIIALTAHGGDENKQRCIEAGMNAVLTKPLKKDQAADILKTFIPARKPLPSPVIKAARRDLPDSDLEMFQMEQFSLFDEEQGIKNSGSKDMLVELLTMMASDIPKDLAKMKNAFEIKDIPQLEHLAHKIKGGAVYVGTTRLKYACQYLERYWKSGERKLFDDLYFQAIKTIEETTDFITDWLCKNGESNK